MSSDYIQLECNISGCETVESIYTGEAYSYEFDDDMWEGESIRIPCKKHST